MVLKEEREREGERLRERPLDATYANEPSLICVQIENDFGWLTGLSSFDMA